MENPFPGMNPYLEKYWPSVHTQLVASVSQALNRQLPEDLVARPEERLSIGSNGECHDLTKVIADEAIFDSTIGNAASSTAIAAPFTLVVNSEPVTERYIKILDGEDRLITVIEFLTPSNKIGKGLKQYVRKRRALLKAGVHVVEADLVRRGDWEELLKPHACPFEARAEYRAIIRLAEKPQIAYVYPWPIRRAIDPLPIPLRKMDPSLKIDLQPILNEVYQVNRYGKVAHYESPLYPPLRAETAKWADELLKARGILPA